MASSQADRNASPVGRILCFGASLATMALVVYGTSIPSQVLTQWLRRPHHAITTSTVSISDALNLLSANVNLRGMVVDDQGSGMTESRHHVKVQDDHAILSGWKFLYRYPSTLSDESVSTKSDEPIVIVGVVSKSHHFRARQTIRQTWAADTQNRVYFIVAGPWKDVAQEFQEHGDMIWLNMDEDTSLITNKVQLLFHAVHAHVDHYDYVMKASDDSDIQLRNVQQHVASSKPNYWGHCRAAQYARGTGYLVSREFNACAASHIASRGIFSSKEDVATGELAGLCGVTCQSEGWNSKWVQRWRLRY